MEWISVKERLPEEEGDYLCCDNSSEYMPNPYIATYKFDWIISSWGKNKINRPSGFYVYSEDYRDYMKDEATHWMSLPKLPKKE